MKFGLIFVLWHRNKFLLIYNFSWIKIWPLTGFWNKNWSNFNIRTTKAYTNYHIQNSNIWDSTFFHFLLLASSDGQQPAVTNRNTGKTKLDCHSIFKFWIWWLVYTLIKNFQNITSCCVHCALKKNEWTLQFDNLFHITVFITNLKTSNFF